MYLLSAFISISRSIPLLLHGNFLFMRSIYIVLGCSLLAFASCGNSGTTTTSTTTDTTKTQAKATREPASSKLNDTGTAILLSVVTKYYAVKDAMVSAKSADGTAAATALGSLTDSLKTFLGKDAVNGPALKPYLDTIAAQCKIVAGIKDESCEHQRLAFGPLSGAMYGLIKNAGLKNAHIYHEYCPMAYNEKGASWLSDDAEIHNPYFGKKMMECGEITDSL
jgi:Cu(I)/Ag(I) efflux system membrane fusion protein